MTEHTTIRRALRIPIAELVAFFNQPEVKADIQQNHDDLFHSIYDDDTDNLDATAQQIAYWLWEIDPNVAAYLHQHAGFWSVEQPHTLPFPEAEHEHWGNRDDDPARWQRLEQQTFANRETAALATIWHFDRSRRSVIHLVTNAVHEAYDGGPLVTLPGIAEPVNAWHHFDLGGDDSVDYNGGYLETVIDIIDYFLNHFGSSADERRAWYDAPDRYATYDISLHPVLDQLVDNT